MKVNIEYIINILWRLWKWAFPNGLESFWDGIVSHTKYPLSNGKVEGVNQKIKTIRRKGYGLPDDEYFFLKLFDASRQRRRSLEDDRTKIPQFLGLNRIYWTKTSLYEWEWILKWQKMNHYWHNESKHYHNCLS